MDEPKVTAKLSAARISLRKPILLLSSKIYALQDDVTSNWKHYSANRILRTLKNKKTAEPAAESAHFGNTKVEEKHWSFPKLGCSACKTTFFSLKAFFCNFATSDD